MAAREPKSAAWQLASDLALGGTVGGVTKTAMAPVERVKLLLQTMESNPDVLSGKVKPYAGVADCVRRVRVEQGIRSFWRGNLVNVLRYGPQQGSALAFNDLINQSMPRYKAETDFWKSLGVNLLSGGLAGALANTIAYPFDFARTRLASDLGAGEAKYKGIGDCITKTVRAQGVTGLYTGWSITVAGAFVYRAGQLGAFKQIQELNPWRDDKGVLGAVSSFCAVTVARSAVMPLNYPFDTIRRRLMLSSELPRSERPYSGAIDCFFKVLRAEGVKGMYRGMLPELARGLGGSLVVVGYDRIKVIFNI